MGGMGVKSSRFKPILMLLIQILSLFRPASRPKHLAPTPPMSRATGGLRAWLALCWAACAAPMALAQVQRPDPKDWVQFPPRNPIAGWSLLAPATPATSASTATPATSASTRNAAPAQKGLPGVDSWVRFPPLRPMEDPSALAAAPEAGAPEAGAPEAVAPAPPAVSSAAAPTPAETVQTQADAVASLAWPEDTRLPQSVGPDGAVGTQVPKPITTPEATVAASPEAVLVSPAPAPNPDAAPVRAKVAEQTSDAVQRGDHAIHQTSEKEGVPTSAATTLPQAAANLATAKPLRFDAMWDNAGEVATGQARTMGRFTMDNLWGWGERAGYDAMYSSGLARMRYFYDQAVGPSAWRLGGFYQMGQYQFLPQNLSAMAVLQPSASGGLSLTSPLGHGEQAGRAWMFSLEQRRFRHESANGWLDSYGSEVVQAQWTHAQADRRAQLTLDLGRLNLAGSARQHSDAVTEQTAGDFAKARWSFSRQWARTDDSHASIQWQGQWASKNLDLSERLALGGPQGVRAYSSGEGAGSQTQLWRLEWVAHKPLMGSGAKLAAFWDAGRSQRLKFKSEASSQGPNDGDLYAAGLWVSGQGPGPLGMLSWQLTWARRLGENPWADAAGRDPDGSQGRDRWWFQAVQPF